MKHKLFWLMSLLLTGVLAVPGVAWARGGTIHVGKTASIILSRETQVGDLLLQAGHYTVRHRVVGTEHYVYFQRWVNNDPEWSWSGPQPSGKPQRAECRIEPLGKTVESTEVSLIREGKIDRITRIEIAGENAAHLF